jgi:hypothetical protein
MGSDANVLVSRAARFNFAAPIVLQMSGRTIRGQCVNISESGMLARLDRPLEIWSEPTLSQVGEWYVNMDVRVARIEGRDTGLAFHISTESERTAIRKLIEVARQPPSP